MNEILRLVKTLVFLAAAMLVAIVAWAVSNRSLPTPEAGGERGQLLYPDFKDPRSVASLEIVKFDETRGEVHRFEVSQLKRGGKGPVRWSIPSHDDYPADATKQVASAATALMGLRIVDVVGSNKDDEREYGVVDPPNKITPGVTGVGEKVIMKDAAGNDLLALVVGKEVPNQPSLRYVRKVGESEIFIVAAKTDSLSTNFDDWIEPNLLQIRTIDLKEIAIRDYSIRETSQGLAIMHRGRMLLAYDDGGEPHWKLLDNFKFAGQDAGKPQGKWTPIPMGANQELAVAKLDELKTALDDLKIVDVSRKPAGLSHDLKVGADFTSNEALCDALADKGFFPAHLDANGPAELFSNEGEIRLLMKDGVEYVLRFGQIAGNGAAGKDAKGKGKKGDKSKDKQAGGVNRYLFVAVEFNKGAIAAPRLETLPDPAKPKEAEKKPDAKAAAETKSDKDKKVVAKFVEAKPAPDSKALEAERAKIERDNKRKQEEYEQRIADGEKRVAELNDRFAEWYYVIADDVYRKIHLGRDEIVAKKAKKDGEKGKDAGRNIPGVPTTPLDQLEKFKNEGPGGN
jgi:hypothetical protein